MKDPEKIDILEDIRIVVASWTSYSKPQTIQNCFIHCKIRTPEPGALEVQEEELVDKEVIEELKSQIREFCYPNPMDIHNLLNYPREEEVTFVPDKEHIIAECLQHD